MLKQKWKTLFITAGCATTLISTAFAQQGVFLGTTPADTNPNRSAASGRIVPASDFAKSVSKIGAQKNDAFQRQLNQQLSQIPKASTPSAPAAVPVAPPSSTSPNSFGSQPANGSNVMQQPVSSPSSADQFNQQPATAPSTAPITTTPTPIPRMPSAPSTPAQSQQPVYTGFPSTPTPPPASQTSQPSGQTKAPSNWNIKY